MESPAETAARLITALEDLVGQETMLLRTMDFVEAVAVQERAAPVVARLCELAADPAVRTLQPRVAQLARRREQNYHFLDAQLARMHEELRRIDEARGRLRQVAPAYGQSQPGSTRLNAAA